MEKNNKKPPKAPLPHLQPGVTMNLQKNFQSPTDVEGSYTGIPLDGDRPVQDVDDL